MLKKSNIDSLMEVLYRKPTAEFTIRGLAKEAGVSPPTAAYFVKGFEKRGFVKVEIFGRAKKVMFNMENEKAIEEKKLRNIKVADEIRDVVLACGNVVKAIVLFGSFSRGEDIENSDIDIAVVSRGKMDLDFSKTEKRLNRKLNLMVFENFKKIPSHLKSSIINGIKLYGVIDA